MSAKEEILRANRDGLNQAYPYGYPEMGILKIAYNLGERGYDLSHQEVVETYRFGGIPEMGVSTNYSTGYPEMGVSSAVRFNDHTAEATSAVWFANRKKTPIRGIASPVSGSDGELLILPITD